MPQNAPTTEQNFAFIWTTTYFQRSSYYQTKTQNRFEVCLLGALKDTRIFANETDAAGKTFFCY